eukprot:Unigene11869_Nuclearia_a/m.36138 Unigene11869_Nuclearia_a/g.36138  ORF Unigene11869_Nuclearia_a/g.36138 Unigene11869_Nuclearia_a/m.36138 type:complete len:269 (-) Unigene11869_Nuclearia_a:75-881(-)
MALAQATALATRAFRSSAFLGLRRVVAVRPPEARPDPNERVQAWVRDFRTGKPVSFVELRRVIFGLPVRRDILQRVIVWQLAKRRAGTHSTKGRNEVRGSTKKMGPQKGSGGARHGTKRAPIFVKGGVAHGPKPRSFAFKLNKKVRSLGLRTALSAKYAQADGLQIVNAESLVPPEPKTKVMARLMGERGLLDKRTLIIYNETMPRNLELSVRNLPLVNTLPVRGLNVYDIIRAHRVIIAQDALAGIEKRFERIIAPPPKRMPARAVA